MANLKDAAALNYAISAIENAKNDGEVILAYEQITDNIDWESLWNFTNYDDTFREQWKQIDDFVKLYCRILRSQITADDFRMDELCMELLKNQLKNTKEGRDVYLYPADFNKLKSAYNRVLNHYDPNRQENRENFTQWQPFVSLVETHKGKLKPFYLGDTFDIELFTKALVSLTNPLNARDNALLAQMYHSLVYSTKTIGGSWQLVDYLEKMKKDAYWDAIAKGYDKAELNKTIAAFDKIAKNGGTQKMIDLAEELSQDVLDEMKSDDEFTIIKE